MRGCKSRLWRSALAQENQWQTHHSCSPLFAQFDSHVLTDFMTSMDAAEGRWRGNGKSSTLSSTSSANRQSVAWCLLLLSIRPPVRIRLMSFSLLSNFHLGLIMSSYASRKGFMYGQCPKDQGVLWCNLSLPSCSFSLPRRWATAKTV